MDFKDRYPALKRWPSWVLDSQKRIFPYMCIPWAQLNEFAAVDGSTTFLLFHDTISEEDQTWRSYAIEAPKDWSVRRRFECGEISWSDFMNARGWIVELSGSWEPYSDTNCRYIEYSDLSAKIKEKLVKLDASGSPYQILHDHLLEHWAFVKECGRDTSKHQAKYEDLIRDHGHMLTKMTTQKSNAA